MKIINNTEDWKVTKVNMFGDSEIVLDKIKEERVFSVKIFEEDNIVHISEKCDDYFGVELNSSECRDLAKVFNGLSDYLDSGK